MSAELGRTEMVETLIFASEEDVALSWEGISSAPRHSAELPIELDNELHDNDICASSIRQCVMVGIVFLFQRGQLGQLRGNRNSKL